MINPQKPVINPIKNFNRFTALIIIYNICYCVYNIIIYVIVLLRRFWCERTFRGSDLETLLLRTVKGDQRSSPTLSPCSYELVALVSGGIRNSDKVFNVVCASSRFITTPPSSGSAAAPSPPPAPSAASAGSGSASAAPPRCGTTAGAD